MDDKTDKTEDIEKNDDSYKIETNSIGSESYSFFNIDHDVSNLSMEGLQGYIKYPMIYNSILREISKECYNSNGMYARSIDTRVSLPLLSYVCVSRKSLSGKKINSKDKKRKKRIILQMKLINHEKTTRDILRKLDIDGMYVGILRDTTASNIEVMPSSGIVESIDRLEGLSLDDNFMIQPLDLDYCKIIGFQNNVAIAAFDMMYFDQFKHGGLVNEIKNYPKDFMKAYLDYRKDSSKRWFILDYKTTIALTARANIDEPYGRPYGMSAFSDMKMQQDYDNSQYKVVNELASSIYYLILPEGEKKGRCSLNSAQQNQVIDSFKNAVKINTNNNIGSNSKISTLTLPTGTTINRLSKDSSLLKDTLSDENIKKISTSLGFASSALNAASEGSSGFAGLQINMDIISSQIFTELNQIGYEYTRLLNNHEGIKPSEYIDIKYLPLSRLNKNDMYDKMKELYMTTGGSRTYMIAAGGVNPEDYMAVCDEEISDNLDNKYKPHITSYTASNSADKSDPDNNLGGAPQKSEDDLSFNGAVTKGTGTNENIKPSTK